MGRDKVNKQKLIERSKEIGLDIVQLVNEYRTSSGEEVNHNEEYFTDFFAGIVAFLCVGNGEVFIEYDADPRFNILDGHVINSKDTEYCLPPKYIDSKLACTETIEIIDGNPVKTYTQETDPITFLELLKRTELGGNPLVKEKEVLRRGI